MAFEKVTLKNGKKAIPDAAEKWKLIRMPLSLSHTSSYLSYPLEHEEESTR